MVTNDTPRTTDTAAAASFLTPSLTPSLTRPRRPAADTNGPWAAQPMRWLGGQAVGVGRQRSLSASRSAAHIESDGAEFSSVSYECDACSMDPLRFEQFVESGLPGNVYRGACCCLGLCQRAISVSSLHRASVIEPRRVPYPGRYWREAIQVLLTPCSHSAAKGLVWLHGFLHLLVFQLAGRRSNPFEVVPVPRGRRPCTQLVFIGRGVAACRDAIVSALDACRSDQAPSV